MNKKLDSVITDYAKQALRTICLAYKDLEPNQGGPRHDQPEAADVKDVEKDGFTLICILGIMDIVRPEVPDAVKTVQAAGVTVRMVTGDNIVTAMAIACQCNIITESEIGNDLVCLEGPVFFNQVGGLICRTCNKRLPLDCACKAEDRKEEVYDNKRFLELMPNLKVLARSRPEDKYLLVTGLRQHGDVVAVTGDGTNDAPALKKADVGFAMGKTGTDVCKEAADILIIDDNFLSIVKACMWGRNVFDNIQRFLQFQLTVNVVALITTFIGSCITRQTPLQPIQLLWVNLIMDSLAALALATEMPTPALLERMPQNRDDYIVSRKMVKHILFMAIYQSIILFVFLFAAEFIIPESVEIYQYNDLRAKHGLPEGTVFPGRLKTWDGKPLYEEAYARHDTPSRHLTWIFTCFVFMQIFNMIACRTIHDEVNICKGIFTNKMFLLIWLIIFFGQVCITQFTGIVFQVHKDGLDLNQWLIAVSIASTVIIVNAILKFVPDSMAPSIGKDSVYERKMAAKAAGNA